MLRIWLLVAAGVMVIALLVGAKEKAWLRAQLKRLPQSKSSRLNTAQVAGLLAVGAGTLITATNDNLSDMRRFLAALLAAISFFLAGLYTTRL